MQGSKQLLRPGVWKFRVYAGRDPKTNRKRQVVRTFHGGTEADADRALADLVLEVRAGRHPHRAGSVADLLQRWMETVDLAPLTRRDYLSAITNHINPALGAVDVARLRTSDLDLFYRRLSGTLGAARVRRCHNILSCALGQAVRWREIPSNPARDARPPAVQRNEIHPPSPEEVVTLLTLAEEKWPAFWPYVYLVASTGVRRAEACGFQWRDVDWDERTIQVARTIAAMAGRTLVEPTKTRRVRRIALDDFAVNLLRRHQLRTLQAAKEEAMRRGERPDFAEVFLFHDLPKLTPWRPDAMTRRFTRLREEAGLPHVTLRQLRHFVATRLLGEGRDVVTVAGRL
ncbi:MAG TPA: site-specific integrase, partial [Nocardioides sp.]